LPPCRAGGFSSSKPTNHNPGKEASTDTRYTLLEKQRKELVGTECTLVHCSLYTGCIYRVLTPRELRNQVVNLHRFATELPRTEYLSSLLLFCWYW
jgi:hypothetical protein